MMNYGTAIGGESESPNYYNNQVGSPEPEPEPEPEPYP